MIDIETFRSRIGRFCQVTGSKRSLFIKKLDRKYQTSSGYPTYRILQVLIKLTCIAVVLINTECSVSEPPSQTDDAEHNTGLLQVVNYGLLCCHHARYSTPDIR